MLSEESIVDNSSVIFMCYELIHFEIHFENPLFMLNVFDSNLFLMSHSGLTLIDNILYACMIVLQKDHIGASLSLPSLHP